MPSAWVTCWPDPGIKGQSRRKEGKEIDKCVVAKSTVTQTVGVCVCVYEDVVGYIC